MIIVGFYARFYRYDFSSDRNHPRPEPISIICSYNNALLLMDNWKYTPVIDPSGYGDYVLVSVGDLEHYSLVPEYIVYDNTCQASSLQDMIDKYNCKTIKSDYIRHPLDIVYALHKNGCITTQPDRISELENKMELLTKKVETQPDISSALINETLVARVNQLQTENAELKNKLQQVINLLQ